MKRIILDAVFTDAIALGVIDTLEKINVRYICEEYTPPTQTQIICRILNARTPTNMAIAIATVNDEQICSKVAPTPERALAALGLNEPHAHAHRLYKQKYPGGYDLIHEDEAILTDKDLEGINDVSESGPQQSITDDVLSDTESSIEQHTTPPKQPADPW